MASAPKPPTPHEAALAEAQNLMQLWLRTKTFFAKANTEDPVGREDEQSFLETKSEVSKYQRTLGPKLPSDVTFGAEKMQDLLRQSISIGHLRALPKPDRQMLMYNWHMVFTYLSRAVGALQFLVEGYNPPPKAAKGKGGSNISQLKGAASGSKEKKGSFISGKTIAIIILFAVAGYMVFNAMKK